MNDIKLGDAKELSNQIEDESVDFLFSDPVYQNLEDYQWLMEVAHRVLKPNRPMLIWGSRKLEQSYVNIFKSNGFNYVYPLNYVVVAKCSRLIYYGNLFTWTTPCYWLNKGKFKIVKSIPDTFIGYANQNIPKVSHKWNKNLEVHLYWMRAFSKPDWLVFDPFAGSGTILKAAKRLNRRYIGFEKDEESYKLALRNLHQTDPEYLVESISENASIF